jgi:hypothetical protein
MTEVDNLVKTALRTLRDRAGIVNDAAGPLVDTDMAITEDRLAEIRRALKAYEHSKSAYHDALRNAGRTPPRQVA